jgi:hypothetical protein
MEAQGAMGSNFGLTSLDRPDASVNLVLPGFTRGVARQSPEAGIHQVRHLRGIQTDYAASLGLILILAFSSTNISHPWCWRRVAIRDDWVW